jgi:peptidoglycan-associated lipoprotein
MILRDIRRASLAVFLAVTLMLGSCKRGASPSTPPSPTPTASLTASPQTILRGQSSTLSWETENATDVTIDLLGKVTERGSEIVNPLQSTTYHLTATGPGGTAQANAQVVVTESTSPQAPK